MKFDISKKILQSYIDRSQWDVDEAQRVVDQARDELNDAIEKQMEINNEVNAAKEELTNLMRMEVAESLMPAIKSEKKPTL